MDNLKHTDPFFWSVEPTSATVGEDGSRLLGDDEAFELCTVPLLSSDIHAETVEALRDITKNRRNG